MKAFAVSRDLLHCQECRCTYQECWGEEILDEPEFDGAFGVFHDTQYHD